MSAFTVAVVQAAPVFLDRDRTVEKTTALIEEAGKAGAGLTVFPEAFIPGYPAWVWGVSPGETKLLRETYAELLANAVAVPDAATERLCQAAKRAKTGLVVGVNERNTEASGTTLFNTLLFVDASGRLLGRHRKLVPTAGERLVWARGDGSTLGVHDYGLARVAGLTCWEMYMPLARYAMYAWGAEVLAAPTWDRGEPWLSTLRHTGKEGRVYVLGSCIVQRVSDIPERFGWRDRLPLQAGEWVNVGGSVIVDPDGKIIRGPIEMKEEILFAEIDLAAVGGRRGQLDVAGHYARPDVFQLTVDRSVRPMIDEKLPPAPERE
jgi:nitrilase